MIPATEVTNEELIQMTVESNNMQFDICINKKYLLGEPEIGRRFRGNIWLFRDRSIS